MTRPAPHCPMSCPTSLVTPGPYLMRDASIENAVSQLMRLTPMRIALRGTRGPADDPTEPLVIRPAPTHVTTNAGQRRRRPAGGPRSVGGGGTTRPAVERRYYGM